MFLRDGDFDGIKKIKEDRKSFCCFSTADKERWSEKQASAFLGFISCEINA